MEIDKQLSKLEWKLSFDETNYNWTGDPYFDIAFLKMIGCYFRELQKVQGYVYLNTIYERMGLKWDPKKYFNICYEYDKPGDLLQFQIRRRAHKRYFLVFKRNKSQVDASDDEQIRTFNTKRAMHLAHMREQD